MSAGDSTVLVLDDDHAILRSLRRLFAAHGYHVRTFSSVDELLRARRPAPPACLILDQTLGSDRGTEALAALRKMNWDFPTIFLTADWNTHTVVQAMRNGADDYITKPYEPDELLAAVVRALENARQAMGQVGEIAELQQRAALLTQRERSIVALVVAGLLNKQIAGRLGIALVTVKLHRGRAMRKLGAQNAAELARLAVRAGITPP